MRYLEASVYALYGCGMSLAGHYLDATFFIGRTALVAQAILIQLNKEVLL